MKNLGYYIIGSAIIWGVTILGCSIALSDTECYAKIQNYLGLGAAIHLILIWGPIGAMARKEKNSKK